MVHQRIVISLALAFVVAFCTPAFSDSIDRIDNDALKSYTLKQLNVGAPLMKVPARALYREALELIERGNWQEAKVKLLLAANLAGDYPDPMFTLAKNELLNADPEFLPHAVEGFKRLMNNFRSQSLLVANISFLVIVAIMGALLVTLVTLTIKYWPLIAHSFAEQYTKKLSVPPTKLIGFLVVVAFLIMRVGLALYVALLLTFLWTLMNRKEMSVVLTMVIILSGLSFFAEYTNILVPIIDPDSVTRRLSLINERGADQKLVDLVDDVNDPSFSAERDYALGTLMYRLKNYEDARRYLLSVVSARPNIAEAYLNLGNVYFQLEDYDKAVAGYQSAIALDSTNVIAFYNLGQAYIKKMLFAQASNALKKSTELGIDNYRTTHPSAQIRNLTIYDQGFENSYLWSVARREGIQRDNILLSEIFQPILLFPFHKLFMLLAGTIVIMFFISIRIPRRKRVFRCDNCGGATCPTCADTETGIALCRDCAGVIEGLSSIKVMEALLRHRRQKLRASRNKRHRWKTLFFPGAAFIYNGKILTGIFIISINIGALISLVSKGFFFTDPAVLSVSTPLWKLIAPIVVLAMSYVISLGVQSQQEPRNYRILPPELKEMGTVGKRKVTIEEMESTGEPIGAF